jgi:L,D-transpeptidase catalytic domain
MLRDSTDAYSPTMRKTGKPRRRLQPSPDVPRNALSGRYPTPAPFFISGLIFGSLFMSAAVMYAGPLSAGEVDRAHDPTVQAPAGSAPEQLSAQDLLASQIADRNGDQDFVLVDKFLGKIILFKSGKPTFSGSALTGERMADRVPPDAVSLKLSEIMGALEYKVTPAGRFTLTRGYSKQFGPRFNINEIKGPDWTIPIQQVDPVTPSERRNRRLESADHTDNQITHGGINVSAETMRVLTSGLPEDRVAVLYVLPYDESKTAEYLTLPPANQTPTVMALADPSPTSSIPGRSAVTTEVLSDQGRQVSQVAGRNGDRTYILVDKPFGKLILFEDGRPTYITTALTGASMTDRVPAAALKKSFSKIGTIEDKVTPAGRFTLTRSYDEDYGQVFSINEIHGPDWEIAIHQVYLGTPSERRTDRLESRLPHDNHITHGCINVTKEAIRFLVSKLGKTKAPVLYVLPHDQTRTLEFFGRSKS